MASRKSAPERKKASGANVENWQRHTQQILLRLQPEIAEMLRASAEAEEMTLAEYVSWLESRRQLGQRLSQAHSDLDAAESRALAIRLWREEREQG